MASGGGGAFNPLSLSPTAWYKADALVLSNDDAVASWADSSGNGNTLTQASGVNRPIYKTNIKNSLPAVLFGASQYMDSAAFGVALAQPGTVIIAAKAPAEVTVSHQAFSGQTGTARWVIYLVSDAYHLFASSDIAGDTATIDEWVILTSVVNGASSSLQKNTATAVTGNAGTYALDGVRLGGSSVPDAHWLSYILEVLVFSSALSAGNITNVQNYLSAKWGIT